MAKSMAAANPGGKLVVVHFEELGLTQRSPENAVVRGGATVMLIFRRVEERGIGDPFLSLQELSLLHEPEERISHPPPPPGLEEPRRRCSIEEEEEREEEKKKEKERRE